MNVKRIKNLQTPSLREGRGGLLVILGAGESGVGAAVLAKKKGFDVFVSDFGKIKNKYKKVLSLNEIAYEEGKHTKRMILNADEVVKSPGIPDKSEMILELKKKKIPIISEIEFAARYTNAKLIGITGTNGKTTTTSLIYHILKKAGYNVKMAGNIGKSFAMMVAGERLPIREGGVKKVLPHGEDLGGAVYYVLELSSFQLDGMFKTRINIAVLTNITPDHLDRYKYKVQNYIDSKFCITQNQTKEDAFIYCADDEIIKKEIRKRKFKAQLFPYSLEKKIKQGAHLVKNKINIHINQHQNPITMFVEELALQGRHNIYNSMAAGIASRLVDVRKSVIRESLSDFQNIEHRLEFVSRVHGVEYINDSKATNVNSTWYALESMTHPTVWIVGGVDKGNDYDMLKDLVKQKVKAIVCLGTDNKKIIKAFSKVVDVIVETQSANDAVKAASRLASKGDTILLSPCCASFDLFNNYEERGRKFKQAVKSL
ncbi:MAG: UDP-N-acetylmuramoyl-L-alanine--D-glutamate ligase [Bacteroidetes bacterium]|nr:UDP-N-acetylmuramoyl-L-alanine--D-glutamate ligase [Bacteroidota bacterium]